MLSVALALAVLALAAVWEDGWAQRGTRVGGKERLIARGTLVLPSLRLGGLGSLGCGLLGSHDVEAAVD
jgi:hypothetical protein